MATTTSGEAKAFHAIEMEAKKLITIGDFEKAGKLYTDFIKQQQGILKDAKILALARNNRGHLRYCMVDFYGAVQDYSEAIELDPSLAVSYYNRGQIHYRMGRYKLAIEDLEKAVELDPNFVDAYDNLRQAKEDLAAKNKRKT